MWIADHRHGPQPQLVGQVGRSADVQLGRVIHPQGGGGAVEGGFEIGKVPDRLSALPPQAEPAILTGMSDDPNRNSNADPNGCRPPRSAQVLLASHAAGERYFVVAQTLRG